MKKTKVKKTSSGRPLWFYFLPTLIVATLLLLTFSFLTTQQLRDSQREVTRTSAITAVDAVAGRIASALDAKRDLLEIIASSSSMHRITMLSDPLVRAAAEKSAAKLLPDIVQLRIIPKGPVVPNAEGPAPLGYAGVDMINKALRGNVPDVEVHQISAGSPYIAMAAPLKNGNDVVGVIFAAWPLKMVTRIVVDTPVFPGDLGITQGDGDGYLLASTSSAQVEDFSQAPKAIPGSIWSLKYSLKPKSNAAAESLLFSLALAGVLALLLGGYLQYRMLARDLRKDMATIVNLGEGMALGHTGIISTLVKVSAIQDAVLLLADLRRKKPSAGKNDKKNLADSEAKKVDAVESKIVVQEIVQQTPVLEKAVIPAAVFRTYDIRGIVGEDLTESFAHTLGQIFATKVKQQGLQKICVARDARLSSPALYAALCDGLLTQEVELIALDQAPIALLYYAMHTQESAAAVMLTGSHNPASYNGFKLYLDTEALHGDALQVLRKDMQQAVPSSDKRGRLQSIDFSTEYIEEVGGQVSLAQPFKIVVDGGNGVAGPFACKLFEALGCEVIPLFCVPDGHFPNHHPDPSHEENMASLALEVEAQEADLGIAFDGDGDRLGVVDDQGNVVWPEHILMMLAGDILQRHPGSDVVYDVKSSRHLASYVLAQGGRPIMWQSGHTRMKDKMRESGALIGGEFSGHFFIKERWYGTDDALYVAARLLEVLAVLPGKLSEVLTELPSSPATEELQLMLPEGEAEVLMNTLEANANFEDARIITMDGLRIEFKQGWGLVRASHTVPSLTFRFEADNEHALNDIQNKFRDLLKAVEPELQAPF